MIDAKGENAGLLRAGRRVDAKEERGGVQLARRKARAIARSIVLFRAFAFLGVMLAGPIANAEGEHAEPDGGATSPSWCEERLLAPFASFLGQGEGHAWQVGETAGEKRLARAEIETAMKPADVLIALVPDPIDSTLIYKHDEILRAVESGVDRTGYLRDQVWLPWEDKHLADTTKRSDDEGCRVVVPGVRIFRSAVRPQDERDDAPSARVVFFVGETPSEGVHKEALRYALELGRRLQRDGAPIRIVGPTFSGSARGIAAVLRELASPNGTEGANAVRAGPTLIISGAATLRSLPSEFEGLGVTFRFTTLDDATIEQLFFRWLRNRDGLGSVADDDGLPRLEHVGLLVESGTAFGELDDCADDAGAGSERAGPSCPEVVLRFERGVSQLQHAYAQVQQAQKSTSSTTGPTVAPEDLDPNLDERSTPADNAAPPHPKSLAAVDLELRSLLSGVAREGLQYLAIRATDAGDAIFLANRVRDVAPNVRLIFLGASILYLHPNFRDDLRGSYVVSPYPFFGTSDFSSLGESDVHVHRPWTSQDAEGVFNATLAVFDGDTPGTADAKLGRLSEYAPFRLPDGGGGCAAAKTLLPLWVSVVGNGTLLPIDAIVPERGAGDSLYNPCPPPPSARAAEGAAGTDGAGEEKIEPRLIVDRDVTPPHGWRLTLYLIVVVLVLHIFFSHAPDLDRAEEATLSQAVYRVQYLAYRLARGVVLCASFAYMVGVHSLSLNAYRWRSTPTDSPWALWSWPAFVWDGLVLAGFLGCSWRVKDVWRALRRAWMLSRSDETPVTRLLRLGRPLVVPAALSVGVLALLGAMAWIDRADYRGGGRVLGVAYTLRALPLGSGASSALVVVLIAGALVSWITDRLRRIRLSHLLAACSPSYPLSGPGSMATPIADVVGEADVKVLEGEVQRAIDRSFSNGNSILRTVFVAAVPVLALVIQRPTTVDGRADGLMLVGLVCVTTLILYFTLQHMAEFYLAFRRLLRRLRTWRLAATLDQAPGITGATVLRILSRNIDDVEPFAACVLVAGELPEDQLPPQAREALQKELQKARAGGSGRGGVARTELGSRLVTAAKEVGRRLESAPLPFPGADGKPRDATLSPAELAAHRLVGCVAALLLAIYVRHIRYYVRGVSAPAVLLACILATYPFEPHRLFLAGAWILILGLAAISTWAYVGLERDVVLSKVSGTLPNEVPLNRELIATIFTVVVIPLLTVLAAQYPDVGRVVLRIFDPFTSVLK